MNQNQDFGGMLSYLLSLQKMMALPRGQQPGQQQAWQNNMPQQNLIPRMPGRGPMAPIQQRLVNTKNPMTPMTQFARPGSQQASFRPGQSHFNPKGGRFI
jgi:hypothetical protein